MEREVKLPYCSRYFPGKLMKLDWLKAITVNDRLTARQLDWHAHDELEVIFPLRGHYRYEFKRRRTVMVDSDSFLVIPPNTPHRLEESIDPPGGRLHLYLRRPSGRTGRLSAFSAAEYARLYEALVGLALKAVFSSSLLKTQISPLGKIVTGSPLPLSDGDTLRVRLLCGLVLCGCETSGAISTDRSPSQTFAEAVRWLERNYASPVRLDRLIERIGYSRARFFSLFRRQTKMTPSEYLRNYRIEKAKEMLVNTDLPVVRVGRACGLGDPAHFSRLFSKMTGCTPLAYRRQTTRPA